MQTKANMKRKIAVFLLVITLLTCSFLSLYLIQIKKNSKDLYLVGIGFGKCGTSALATNLSMNKKVHSMSRQLYNGNQYFRKDTEMVFWLNPGRSPNPTNYNQVNYFAQNISQLSDAKSPLDWYQSHMKKGKINIEKSPIYITQQEGLKALKKHYPNVKIIISVRCPIDFIYSAYNHNLTREKINCSFEEFLQEDKNQKEGFQQQAHFINYIEKVYEIFPKKNIFLIPLEDLPNVKDLHTLCKMFNIPCSQENQPIEFYYTRYQDKINPEVYAALKAQYTESNEKLFQFIGRRIPSWD